MNSCKLAIARLPYRFIANLEFFASQGFSVYFAPHLWRVESTENPWLAKMQINLILHF